MEEEKAAAYYEELTRKGGGAARFKQGLGFSSSSASDNDGVPTKHAPSSSFLSNFVKASSPTTTSNLQKQSELQSIQNKLKKKHTVEEQTHSSRVSRNRERDHEDRDRDRERKRDYGDRNREKDYRNRDRETGYRDRDRERERDRGRDYRDSDRDRERRRSVSPRERREEKRSDSRKARKERSDKVDYSRLIEGYDKMV